MTIYGIKCIWSEWDGCNGCDTDEYLLDYFFSTREKAEAVYKTASDQTKSNKRTVTIPSIENFMTEVSDQIKA
jgi:hypothetical protein